MKSKEKILEELKKIGWEYVVDEFTCSEYGHRREHFENVIETNVDEQKIYTVKTVLIFHYLWNRKHNAPHIQTYIGGMYYDLDEARKRAIAFKNTCCCLEIKEMQLFLEYMKVLRKEDKLKDKECK